jgi:CheY-like chemotaxis protein
MKLRRPATWEEALLVLERGGITVVLTDIEMPGPLNGLDLARMIRAVWPSIPLIVTSGRTLPRPDDLPAHALMMTKPFSTERLLFTLRSAT